MKAIVYRSCAGHTKRYAEMLSEKLKLPAYTISEARKQLAPKDPIIFMGWLRSGEIMGYDSIWRKYKITAIVAVGMSPNVEATLDIMELHYASKTVKVPKFYLPGGFNRQAVRPPHNIMAAIMIRLYKSNLGDKMAEKYENEAGMKRVLENEEDLVDEKYLEPIIEWYNK